jgi:hypothetical protein
MHKEDSMARRKSISFDAMVKFFMQTYNIPTKKDVEKLMTRMDRLEALIKTSVGPGGNKSVAKKGGPAVRRGGAAGMTASDSVLGIIKKHRNGVDFSTIQAKTGFDEKKLRNIIFRLNKLGRITRKARGTYVSG